MHLNAEWKTDWAYEKWISTYRNYCARFKTSEGYSGGTPNVVTTTTFQFSILCPVTVMNWKWGNSLLEWPHCSLNIASSQVLLHGHLSSGLVPLGLLLTPSLYWRCCLNTVLRFQDYFWLKKNLKSNFYFLPPFVSIRSIIFLCMHFWFSPFIKVLLLCKQSSRNSLGYTSKISVSPSIWLINLFLKLEF